MTYAKLYPFFVIVILASYLCGTINFAVILTKAKGSDIRKFGSGNPGTMNMLRNFGGKMGAVCLFLDALKGFLPVFLTSLFFKQYAVDGFAVSDLAMALSGLSAVLGHIFPVTMKFKGGKGVATCLGVFLAMSPLSTAIIFAVGVIFILLFEYGGLGSMLFISAMGSNMGITLARKYAENGEILNQEIKLPYFLTCLLIFATCFIIYFAHKKNIYQLIFGTEHKTKLRKILFKK